MSLKITKLNKITKPLLVNTKKDIVNKLRNDLLLLDGYKPVSAKQTRIRGLESIEVAFPGKTFPTGAIHEFLSFTPEQTAASAGFIGGLLTALMKKGTVCVWVSATRHLFPASLRSFGVEPDKIIFIDVAREKDTLWVTEEALKCKGIAAVIAEVRELTFMQSRRLQLAVETSCVTGFILRTDERRMCTTACLSRWQIIPEPSKTEAYLPGLGFPRWQVALQKVRNGKPGNWTVEWSAESFTVIEENQFSISINNNIRQTG